MRENSLNKYIPIVGLTAYNDEKYNCMEAGMKRFMTKPANQTELKETLVEVMSGNLSEDS